jgi:hypothetical protein
MGMGLLPSSLVILTKEGRRQVGQTATQPLLVECQSSDY